MDHTREILTEQAAQRRTLGRVERLLWRVLGIERILLMDEETALTLLSQTKTLIETLESSATVDHLADPAMQAALSDLKATVDAASATPPATGDEDGSDSGAANESDQDATTVTTPDGSSAE